MVALLRPAGYSAAPTPEPPLAHLTERAPRRQPPQPHGRAAVRDALVDAGIELFSARGPGAVSVRQVAAAAGVNHALVFRHFGSKDGLVRAVFEALFGEVRRLAPALAVEGDDPLAEGMRGVLAKPELWRLLAYAALEGGDRVLDDIPSPFLGGAQRRIEERQREGAIHAGVDAPVLMACGIALALGWAVFQRMLLRVAGLEDAEPDEQRSRVENAWREFIEPR
jgi:TetR/AcrR family transcriptional regulator, repressor for neighboring sulfatase